MNNLRQHARGKVGRISFQTECQKCHNLLSDDGLTSQVEYGKGLKIIRAFYAQALKWRREHSTKAASALKSHHPLCYCNGLCKEGNQPTCRVKALVCVCVCVCLPRRTYCAGVSKLQDSRGKISIFPERPGSDEMRPKVGISTRASMFEKKGSPLPSLQMQSAFLREGPHMCS